MSERLKEIARQYLPHWALRPLRFSWGLYFELTKTYVNQDSGVIDILKENWKNYKSDPCPVDRRMKILQDNQVEGMCCENISFLINEIVRRFAKNGAYLEVGSFMGYSLLSAALFNQTTRCIGIDNYSEFDEEFKNEGIFKKNLEKFKAVNNIEFHNCDYIQALRLISQKDPAFRIAVYYYDGSHSYKDQLNGLNLALPLLSERSVILVDDLNYKPVEDANRHFLNKNKDFKSVFRIKTRSSSSRDWWNGLEIIARGI